MYNLPPAAAATSEFVVVGKKGGPKEGGRQRCPGREGPFSAFPERRRKGSSGEEQERPLLRHYTETISLALLNLFIWTIFVLRHPPLWRSIPQAALLHQVLEVARRPKGWKKKKESNEDEEEEGCQFPVAEKRRRRDGRGGRGRAVYRI